MDTRDHIAVQPHDKTRMQAYNLKHSALLGSFRQAIFLSIAIFRRFPAIFDGDFFHLPPSPACQAENRRQNRLGRMSLTLHSKITKKNE